ncbi:MAG: hypothetical protein EBZ77_12895 [Chitinophagia bacterium]|nr:hypothetical protein [Chitinophagia bacterium]
MPFEPFYNRNPAKPFAQYGRGATLCVLVKGNGPTGAELASVYQKYMKWINEPLGGIGLTFIWKLHPEPVPPGPLVRVTFSSAAGEGGNEERQADSMTYDIKHNIRTFDPEKRGAQVCLHEFLHILGVPHEINNPLVHFCLKPNWENILQWESRKTKMVQRIGYLCTRPSASKTSTTASGGLCSATTRKSHTGSIRITRQEGQSTCSICTWTRFQDPRTYIPTRD